MSDFTDLVVRAVNPDMPRDEREHVYATVRAAIRALHDRDARSPVDPQTLIQQHVVEETIRDVEAQILRFLAQRRLEQAQAAQRG